MSKTKTIIAATLFGNMVEFYSFMVYSFFSSIIASHFFLLDNQSNKILLTLAIFSSGYFIRPLGSLFFGYVGDKHGRRVALLIAITLMTVATFSMSLLRGYASIGIWAPILLLMCRLIQGFSVSGEACESAIFLTETLWFNRKNLIGSLILSTALAGIALGAISCLAVKQFVSESNLQEWGWRIPFALSAPLGIIALILRLKIGESPAYVYFKNTGQKLSNPLKMVFSKLKKTLLTGIALISGYAVCSSIYLIFLPVYLKKLSYIPSYDVLFATGIIVMAVLTPVFGVLADKIGSYKLLSMGYGLLLIIGYPIFWLFESNMIGAVILAAGIVMLFVSLFAAPVFSVLIGLFDMSYRCTAVSLAFNTGIAFFAGITPMLLTHFLKADYFVMVGGTVMFLVGVLGLYAIYVGESLALPVTS